MLSLAASSAPVCELAARAPAEVRPALTARTGFARATRRATRPNLRGLPKDSRYRATTCVAGSCSQYCRTSLLDRSALSPSDTNAESPIPRRDMPSIAAAPNAPLWDTKPTVPAGTSARAKVAVSDTAGSLLTTPMQLGPTSRIPVDAAGLEQLREPGRALGARLREPGRDHHERRDTGRAHTRGRHRAPARPGTATIARSTGPGTSPIDGLARRLPMKSAFGLTG